MPPNESSAAHANDAARAAASASAVGVACAIPARFASTRLPGKPLRLLAGLPMIEHVYRRASRARGISRVVVLTDDERIAAAVDRFGGAWQMTPGDCPSATDRVAWAARDWSEEIVVNVQGDEPLLEPSLVEGLAAHLASTPEDEMATYAAPAARSDLDDPAKVKVVTDLSGRALYFGRAPLPFPRDPAARAAWPSLGLRHVGIYGYRRATLLRLASLAPTPLELAESLEQLRALEHGVEIRVLRCEHSGFGVDTERDLQRAEELLRSAPEDASAGSLATPSAAPEPMSKTDTV